MELLAERGPHAFEALILVTSLILMFVALLRWPLIVDGAGIRFLVKFLGPKISRAVFVATMIFLAIYAAKMLLSPGIFGILNSKLN